MNTPNFLEYFANFPYNSTTRVKNAVMIPARIFQHRIYLLTTLEKRLNGRHEWGFPGGKIDSGETIYEACFREFEEETNTRITGNDIHILATFSKSKTFFMVVELLVDIPKFTQNNDILDLRWIPWESFLDALYNHNHIDGYGLRRCMKTLRY